jgi:hypothetical protein
LTCLLFSISRANSHGLLFQAFGVRFFSQTVATCGLGTPDGAVGAEKRHLWSANICHPAPEVTNFVSLEGAAAAPQSLCLEIFE